MLTDDKRAILRMAGNEELLIRADEFLATHNPKALPALIVQLWPTRDKTLILDVDNESIRKRFAAGVEGDDGWWCSFKSYSQTKPTLHGFATMSGSEEPTWACEAHHDAHFIAGLWHFPTLMRESHNVPVLATFHAQFFKDFLILVQSTLGSQESGKEIKFNVTAAVVRASKLYFAAEAKFGNSFTIRATPLSQENLQFPIYRIEPAQEDWSTTANQMARALCGAYGVAAPTP
ncbi:hypothetical protein CSC67_00790 [Pusillimonas caeni]|uniref:hypothetical protein n=1 Tax=Pusillimonas caeni TaxID=1348472 RepID=UPI000E5A035C|nr:hypothetical protein [Pusillimonas caeni]TFL15300.1 hypothetical protein CSC67_00790 [Pusillimonas caeni]